MKFKHILASLLAAASLFAGCTEEFEIQTLPGVEYSSSYVGLSADGGSASITFTSDQSWTVTDNPSWVTVSPASGSAGTVTITFSADANTSSKLTGDVKIVLADGQTQIITVAQAGGEPGPSTCAEVIAGENGKSFKVTGTVTSIANTHYGNWYINDGTGEVYIYGTCDKKGNTNSSSNSYDNLNDSSYASSWDLSVGDVVTITGPKTTYSGVVELVDVTIVSITKSLLTVEEESYALPKDGGEVEVKVVYKGNDLQVKPQVDWISLGSIDIQADTTFVTLKVAENTADPRTGEVYFASAIPGQASEATVTISQAGVSGTLATPFTVAQAIEYCKNLTSATTENFYVKGIVTKTLYTFSASYGNGTFWISDDGTDYLADNKKSTNDKSHDFECYSVLWLGNTAWVDGEAQVAPGDEVIICGQLTCYNGTCETNSKKAYVYSINGCTVAGAGAGNQDYPFTVAGAVNATNGGLMNTSKNYFVKGICSKVLYTFSASYGTGTFWLSDDGAFNGYDTGKGTDDKAHDFEAYSVYWLGNTPWTDGCAQVEVGDEVVVAGKLTLYNGLTETSSKKAYVYSINGKTE